MTLAQLKYFTAICDQGSVSAAAQSLFLSQPSLSAAVAELEEEFGVPLFHRHRRGMSLTEEGCALYDLARRLLEQAEHTRRLMTELGQGRPVLRLGVPPMIGSLLLPVLYRDFLPGTQGPALAITEGGRQELLSALEDGKLDMALLPHDRALPPALACLPAAEFETVCCVRVGHPLAGLARISPAQLKDTPLVLFQDSFFQTQLIKDRFTGAGITPRILLQTQQLSTLQSMVDSTDAAGFLFRQLLEGQSRLCPIPLSDPIRVQVSLVWRQDKSVLPAMERLRQFVAEHAPRL